MKQSNLLRVNKIMMVSAFTLAVLTLGLNALCWVYPVLGSVKGGYGFSFALTNNIIEVVGNQFSLFPWWQKLVGCLISTVPLLFLAYAFYHLGRLFQGFIRAEFFSADSALHLEKAGHGILGWLVLNLVCEPLLTFWMTRFLPEGQRFISLSMDSSAFIGLFLAGSITIIAYVLRQAGKIDAENKEFI